MSVEGRVGELREAHGGAVGFGSAGDRARLHGEIDDGRIDDVDCRQIDNGPSIP
jgi:hypothetical protein